MVLFYVDPLKVTHCPPSSYSSPFPLFLSPKCRRKSYEFEDLLQSSSENGRVDWYAQTKLALTRTLSEENVYEDILGRNLGCGGGWMLTVNDAKLVKRLFDLLDG